MAWIYSITKTYNTVFEYEQLPIVKKPYKIAKLLNATGEVYVYDDKHKICVAYVPTNEKEVEVYYIVNGEYFGVCIKELLYRDETLLIVADGGGISRKVHVIQLHGVKSLRSLCRNVILKHTNWASITSLCLPLTVQNYLLYKA